MTFAAMIRKMISKTGLSQKEIAKKMDIPIRTLESWIQGKRVPDKFKQKAIIEQIIKIKNEE